MRIRPPCTLLYLVALLGAGTAGAGDATMRAAIVSPGRVQLRDVARPVPAPGQVLVKMRYAGVNPIDWQSAGAIGAGAVAIPGVDGAGEISALGAGVRGYRIGDAVIVWSQARGTYAQFVAVPADTITPKPARLSFAEAAGIAHAGLAAWELLIAQARVHAGQSVLVLGGAGGVGSAAVQIARIRGATVSATASARNADYLRALGATTVIDYATQHFEERLRNIDIALNTVDDDNGYRALAVLRRGGRLLATAGLPTQIQCAARGVICSGPSPTGTQAGAALKQIADWSQAGIFKVNIDRTFELAEVLQAWQYSQAGHTRGKCVIRINQ